MNQPDEREPDDQADPTAPTPTGLPTSHRYDAETAYHDESDPHEPDGQAQDDKAPPSAGGR
jgi:hypothetical protein